MRKEAKKATQIKIAEVQGYHQGIWNETYAFQGFDSNKLFTSDRTIKLDSNFRRADGLPLDGFGLEIETECWGIRNVKAYADVLKKIIFPLFPADLFKMQSDSSLGSGGSIGVECITQVMKKSFIRNHYNDFRAMWQYFEAFNISCSRTGNCGMHVNVSNSLFGKTVEQQKEAIRKLHYFINANYELACKLLKRDSHHTGFCGRMDYSNARTMDITGGDHYVCMNYSHFNSGRIELRLVGGQKDYYAFRNTMETIFFLVERVRKITWNDLDNLAKFFKGCNQYVYKRLQDCDLPGSVMVEIHDNLKLEDLEIHD